MLSKFRRSLYILSFLLITACTAATEPPSPAARFSTTAVVGTPEVPNAQSSSYPAPSDVAQSTYPVPSMHSVDGRSQSALTSYKIALDEAKAKFDPAAQLYAVAPSHVMIGNLGGPPVLPGWFFRFKKDDGPREFIVQVVDTVITGTTLAESIEPPTPRELPIDVAQVKLDSPQVFEQFKTVVAQRSLPTDPAAYDFELVNLEGKGTPIWSIIDPTTSNWLYSVDAISGNEVPNPHQ